MIKGFNKDGFLSYLDETFSGFDNIFLREMVSNVIDYALEHCHHSLDQACYFLSDMLPEVEFAEVAIFMDDSMLTYHGREVKREALEERLASKGDRDSGFESLDSLMAAASHLQQSDITAVVAQMDHVFGNNVENAFPER